MVAIRILKYCMIFLIGALFGMFLFYLQMYGLESPFSTDAGGNSAPHDWISEDKIHVYADRIVLDISGASLSKYADTGSMKPVFDKGANGIRIIPSSEDVIKVGDIITFEKDGLLIVHRVIEIGSDDLGKYFITKGDNNDTDDGKVRFEDIKYVTVAVVY